MICYSIIINLIVIPLVLLKQTPTLEDISLNSVCEYTQSYGLDYQILKNIIMNYNTNLIKFPGNDTQIDISQVTFPYFQNSEFISKVQQIQQIRGQQMDIKQGLILLGEQYLAQKWNSEIFDQKCGSNKLLPGDSIFQNGLAIQVEDEVGWLPYFLENDFLFNEDEHAFYQTSEENLTNILIQSLVEISEGVITYTESLEDLSSQMDQLQAHGYSQRESPEKFIKDVFNEINPEKINSADGLVNGWQSSHYITDKYNQQGTYTIAASESNLYNLEGYCRYDAEYDCNCRKVCKSFDIFGLCIGSKKTVCDICYETSYHGNGNEFIIKKTFENVHPHFKLGIQYEGFIEGTGEYQVNQDDYIQIKINDVSVKKITANNRNSKNRIISNFETEHHGDNIKVEIIHYLRYCPPVQNAGISKFKMTVFNCKNECKDCKSFYECTQCSSSRQDLQNERCLCSEESIDQILDQSCIPKNKCDRNYSGPFFNEYLPIEQNSYPVFEKLKDAIDHCDIQQFCKGITYAKNGNGIYEFQLRNSDLLVGQKEQFGMMQYSQGKVISWTKFINKEECCAFECLECYQPYDYNSCTLCRQDFFLEVTTCSKYCSDGFFGNIETQQCEQCHSQCLTCIGPNEDQCMSCKEGKIKANNFDQPSLCIEECPSGQTANEEQTFCIDCHPYCQECFDGTNLNCPVCKENIYSLGTNECHQNCPLKYFEVEETLTCEKCHESCLACSGPSIDQCTQCEEGLYLDLDHHTCVDTCDKFRTQDNVYCASNCPFELLNDYLTMTCRENCSEGYLQKENSQDCVICLELEGNYKIQDELCVKNCHDPYYEENEDLCLPCHNSCLTCSGPSQAQCTSCLLPLYLINNQCLSMCGDGQYFIEEKAECRDCFSSCKICSDSSNSCLECKSNFPYFIQISSDRKTCHAGCPTGYKKNLLENSWMKNQIECIPCDQNIDDENCGQIEELKKCPIGFKLTQDEQEGQQFCQKCEDTNCISCLNDYQFCDECLPSYYAETTGNISICKPCAQRCEKCSGPFIEDCETCQSAYFSQNYQTEDYYKYLDPKFNKNCKGIIDIDQQQDQEIQEDYSRNFSNLYNYEDYSIEQIQFSDLKRSSRENIRLHGSNVLKNLLSNNQDCQNFKMENFKENTKLGQEVFLLSIIASDSLENNQEQKIIDPVYMNQILLSQSQPKKDKFSVNFKIRDQQNYCNKITCSYTLNQETNIYLLDQNIKQQLSIKKDDNFIQNFKFQGKQIEQHQIKQGKIEIPSYQIEETISIIKNSSDKSNFYYTLKISGKSQDGQFLDNIQAIILSIDPNNNNNLVVFSPIFNSQLNIKLQGEQFSEIDEQNQLSVLFQYYNVLKIERYITKIQNISLLTKPALYLHNNNISEEFIDHITQSSISDSFFIDIFTPVQIQTNRVIQQNLDLINHLKENSSEKILSVNAVYSPCFSQENRLQEIESFADQLGNSDRLWVNALNYTEFYQYKQIPKIEDDCEWDPYQSNKNLEKLREIVEILKDKQIKIGILSKKADWKLFFDGTEEFKYAQDDIRVWYHKLDNNDERVKNWNTTESFGGWRVNHGKTFIEKYPIIYQQGIYYSDLVSFYPKNTLLDTINNGIKENNIENCQQQVVRPIEEELVQIMAKQLDNLEGQNPLVQLSNIEGVNINQNSIDLIHEDLIPHIQKAIQDNNGLQLNVNLSYRSIISQFMIRQWHIQGKSSEIVSSKEKKNVSCSLEEQLGQEICGITCSEHPDNSLFQYGIALDIEDSLNWQEVLKNNNFKQNNYTGYYQYIDQQFKIQNLGFQHKSLSQLWNYNNPKYQLPLSQKGFYNNKEKRKVYEQIFSYLPIEGFD